MDIDIEQIIEQWGTTAIIVAVALVVVAVVVALVKRAVDRRPRTPERVLRERDKAQGEYDHERKALARMGKGSVWTGDTDKETIEQQRAKVAALRERVQMLDDELMKARAGSDGA